MLTKFQTPLRKTLGPRTHQTKIKRINLCGDFMLTKRQFVQWKRLLSRKLPSSALTPVREKPKDLVYGTDNLFQLCASSVCSQEPAAKSLKFSDILQIYQKN